MLQVDRPERRLGRAGDARRPDRGWSLDFSASGRLGAALGAPRCSASPGRSRRPRRWPPATTRRPTSTRCSTRPPTRRDRLVGRRLHRAGRRRRAHRHGVSARSTAWTARQGRLRPGPLARVAGAEPDRPRHQRPRHVHGRAHRRPRRTATYRGHGARRADRVASRSASPTAAPTSPRSSPRSTGSSSTGTTTASTSGSSTCPTARTRRRPTGSTRSPTPPNRPGRTASWSSPPPATTASRAT